MEEQDLAQELKRLRSLLRRIYPQFVPPPGAEELQAELEREVLRLVVLEGALRPGHLTSRSPERTKGRPWTSSRAGRVWAALEARPP